MDGGTWWATVHEAAESQTRLSDFSSLFTSVSCIAWVRTALAVITNKARKCHRSPRRTGEPSQEEHHNQH